MSDDNKLVAEVREPSARALPARSAPSARSRPSSTATAPSRSTSPCPATRSDSSCARPTPVLELDIDGKTELALVKDVQKDPVRQIIEHLDLIVIRKGEKVQVDVPVHVEGETFPARSSTSTPTPSRSRSRPPTSPRRRRRRRGPRRGRSDLRQGRRAAQGLLAHHRPRDARRSSFTSPPQVEGEGDEAAPRPTAAAEAAEESILGLVRSRARRSRRGREHLARSRAR